MIPAGRVSLTPRAIQRTVAAIAAEELEVPVREVGIRLSDERGLLAILVDAPLRMDALGHESGTPGVLSRGASARAAIRTRTLALTGSQVRAVALRVTRAVIEPERRVA